MTAATLDLLTLDASLAHALNGEAAAKFSPLGLHTVRDLITYWPRKWRERGSDIDLALIPDGEQATVHCHVVRIRETALRTNSKRRVMRAECVTTHGRALEVSLFSPWKARKDGIVEGAEVTFSGKVTTYRPDRGQARRQMSSPEYALDDEQSASLAGTVVTVYPATAATPSPWIAEQVASVLHRLPGKLADAVPTSVLARHGLATYDWAVRNIHLPASVEDAEHAKKRLTYDEALAVQVALAVRRHGVAAHAARPLPQQTAGLLDQFDATLPFSLTDGQSSAGHRIAASLACTRPMNVLVEGDVGSGKTVVAVRAMLQAVDAGAQCAFVAPTEVLATQHHTALTEMLTELDVRVELLTGSVSASDRRMIEQGLADGSIDIVVGTHVLTGARTEFANLGLVVVDEQHRFGVAARDALRDQPVPPHMLVMTATPIPRTLAMTVYGDLDVVELVGLPEGRKPVSTVVVPIAKPTWVQRVWTRIGEEVAAGRQAFVVASLIDATDRTGDADSESVNTPWADESEATSAAASIHQLHAEAARALPTARIGLLHGRLDAATKRAVMGAFAAGDLDVLITTTVIEVGVNVPNATVMAIWDADRFGIAQLHQLRGRVGRGEHPGLCLLVTGMSDTHPAMTRLGTVAKTLDGHQLALADLKARREGDVLGSSQAGRSAFKLLDLSAAQRLIAHARKDAEEIVTADPLFDAPEHAALAEWVRRSLGEDAGDSLARS